MLILTEPLTVLVMNYYIDRIRYYIEAGINGPPEIIHTQQWSIIAGTYAKNLASYVFSFRKDLRG